MHTVLPYVCIISSCKNPKNVLSSKSMCYLHHSIGVSCLDNLKIKQSCTNRSLDLSNHVSFRIATSFWQRFMLHRHCSSVFKCRYISYPSMHIFLDAMKPWFTFCDRYIPNVDQFFQQRKNTRFNIRLHTKAKMDGLSGPGSLPTL